MKIVVTGATGMVGSALVPFLARGHEVVALSRSGRPGTVRWDPGKGEIDAAGLVGASAVVHLAGANIAEGRWTAERKRAILDSRIDGTRLLVAALSRLPSPPRILISASAIGYYGDTGDREVDESASAGKGFLADVCRAWEAEATKAAELGSRVVLLRSGIILSKSGGPLAKMLPFFKKGLGGRVGSGRQWVSWIALDDLLGVIVELLDSDEVGPVNAVAPGLTTNAEFTTTLARVLGRPAVVPVPAGALRMVFGEMAEDTLLASARVRPARLEARGFSFRFPALEAALRHVLSGD